jgi:hypothetical protein
MCRLFRSFPALLPALALCWGVLAQPAGATSVEQVGDAVVFRGRIDQASATTFLQLLQDPRVTRLVITSFGGLVAPALDMAEALHARGLDVEVPESCLSSCANYIFPAGRHKLLGRPDAVGWHGNMAHVLYREQAGQERWSAPLMADARRLARREAAFFRRIGVDGFVCWFGKIPPYGEREFYALSVRDMARFGIRDVIVRAAPAGAVPAGAVRLVKVNWASLERVRPVLRLDR